MSNVRGVFLAMRQLEPSSTAGAQQRSFFERDKGGTTIEPLQDIQFLYSGDDMVYCSYFIDWDQEGMRHHG